MAHDGTWPVCRNFLAGGRRAQSPACGTAPRIIGPFGPTNNSCRTNYNTAVPLERFQHDNGVVIYRSRLLHDAGIPHGFTTRLGGISEGPYASLHLQGWPDEQAAAAEENIRRAGTATGLADRPIVRTRQIHGGQVWHATEPIHRADPPEADAIVLTDPAMAALIRVADCVPILLATRDGRAVAAIHAGWRGVIADVVIHAMRTLLEKSAAQPDALLAAIGPCISAQAFEVGEEVADAFSDADLSAAIVRVPGHKPHINLPAALQMQLQSAGLSANTIDLTDRCTHRDADEFFSHRRDRGITGRQAAMIGPTSGIPHAQ